MPELPEVETVCRDLHGTACGLNILDAKVTLPKLINVTPAKFRNILKGKTILNVRRRAKIINIELSDGYSLLVHLKMSGQLLYLPPDAPMAKHTHIVMKLSNGYHLRFRDQRQFGYMKLFKESDRQKFFEEMGFGPEPLEKSFTLDDFKALLLLRPKNKIKPLLIDQSFVSGIGNLYADEILHFAHVHPLRQVHTLSKQEISDIYKGIRQILTLASRNAAVRWSYLWIYPASRAALCLISRPMTGKANRARNAKPPSNASR